jgi:hypothetical protein
MLAALSANYQRRTIDWFDGRDIGCGRHLAITHFSDVAPSCIVRA